jgi:hypothetical protein
MALYGTVPPFSDPEIPIDQIKIEMGIYGIYGIHIPSIDFRMYDGYGWLWHKKGHGSAIVPGCQDRGGSLWSNQLGCGSWGIPSRYIPIHGLYIYNYIYMDIYGFDD